MAFHRLTVPSYFGGLPGGYDLINDPTHPSVGGSGVAALADGQKSGGPNDGTYFVAFGEDGTSEHANRPVSALAENTDFLDDVLRTSIPTFTTTDATAVGAVSTIALVGQVYVGKSGTTDTAANRERIVRITDQNNNDLEVSGSKILVTLIHDGASVNVVGTQASGFRTNASVNVAPPIPNGTAYRVWWGTRNNITNISQVDKGALFEEQMRLIQNVSGEVRALFRLIHSETSVNQAWDAAFDSTIRSLASAGLNERYRRATLQPAGFVSGDFNTAGAGAVINRDGRAVTIQTDIFTLASATAYRDPNGAALKIEPESARSSDNGITHLQGGDIGYWHEVEWRAQDDSDNAMLTRVASSGPALLEVIPWDVQASSYDGDNFLTRISPVDATASLNPDGLATTADQQTVQCAAGQFFSLTGPTRTAIRLGIDLLEVTRANGDKSTFIIDELVSSTRVKVRLLSGGRADFGSSTVNGVAIRWIQPIVKVGGCQLTDAGAGHGNLSGTNILTRPIVAIPPSIATVTPGNECVGLASFFGAQTGSVLDATAELRRARAIEFGATASPDSGGVVNGGLTARAWINGDGSARFTKVTNTGTSTVAGAATVGGDLTVGDDITVAGDATVGDDVIAGGDVVAGNLVSTMALAVNQRERFIEVDEDWTRFVQEFTPDLIHADELWEFDELADVFTLNNGTPSTKNPGQLQIIGAGGSVGKQLAIYKTTALPYAFANVEMLSIVVKVNDDVANIAPLISIGLTSDVAAQNGGNNCLTLVWNKAVSPGSWTLQHRVGGAGGVNNNDVVAAFTNNQYIHFKLIKNSAGNWDIFANGSGTPAVTILAANFPTGNCSIGAHLTQSAADANAMTITWDYVGLRALTATSRHGA